MTALVLLAALVATCPPCVPHTPYARMSERIQLARPGATVRNEVTFRNTDGCGCARACFALSYGPHPPQPGVNMVRVEKTSLQNADGTPVGPALCLDPGEERTASYVSRLSDAQDPPAYLTPSLMLRRVGGGLNGVDWFDCEGGVLAVGFTYDEARAFLYDPAPSQ